jgi:NAD(P)-dependent dehydrogenase (short-subunit alcohol dehydrogenase family)
MATVVVTGANRGIGLELCRQGSKGDDTVVGVCRKPSDELAGLDVRVISGVDITSDESVDALAAALQGTRIDVLIHNAGLLEEGGLDSLDLGSIRRQLEVNAIAPLRITSALLPCLGKGSKVAIVTSRMGSIADNTSGGAYGYRMSKAAVNMAGVSLAHDLRPRGIAVAILHPGFVRTGMTGGHGNVEASESASQLWERIHALTLEDTGRFWHANGERLPW